MLGSAVLSVRLGGIYGLARLAEDHPDQYHVPIFQLLCSFVRRPPEEDKKDEPNKSIGKRATTSMNCVRMFRLP